MADLPDTIGFREVMYGERTPPARRLKVAHDLLQAGRVYEALDLFLVAGDEKGVLAIRERAVKEGLPVLLLMLRRAGRAPKPAEWTAAGAAAFAAGRFREAFRCYREAGDEEGLAKVREKLPNYELYTPQGK
jgi:hypothetical protein